MKNKIAYWTSIIVFAVIFTKICDDANYSLFKTVVWIFAMWLCICLRDMALNNSDDRQ